MDDDLDIPAAIEALRALTDEILTADDTDTSDCQRGLRQLTGFLGLTLAD